MANSTGYVANKDNSTWREMAEGQQVGKGAHAEIQVLTAIENAIEKKGGNAGVVMFVQDQAPCDECHKSFISKSAAKSFIFIIKETGYPIQSGVSAPMTNASGEFVRTVIMSEAVQLEKNELPVAYITIRGRHICSLSRTTSPPIQGSLRTSVERDMTRRARPTPRPPA